MFLSCTILTSNLIPHLHVGLFSFFSEPILLILPQTGLMTTSHGWNHPHLVPHAADTRKSIIPKYSARPQVSCVYITSYTQYNHRLKFLIMFMCHVCCASIDVCGFKIAGTLSYVKNDNYNVLTIYFPCFCLRRCHRHVCYIF